MRDLLATVADIPAILATVRGTESGNNYTATNAHSTASGAYMYTDTTWGGFGGYKRAKDAPPDVQDRRAAQDASRILTQYGGSVRPIFTWWYWPLALKDPTWLDKVPMPASGNQLTVGGYTDLQVGRLADLLGRPAPDGTSSGVIVGGSGSKGITATPAIDIPNPFNIPGDVAGAVGDGITSAMGALINAIKEPLLWALIAASGLGLVVLGVAKSAGGSQTGQQLSTAAAVAAV